MGETESERRGWFAREGEAFPLGVTWVEGEAAWNFAVYSKHATAVTLLLYAEANPASPLRRVRLDPLRNKSGRIWHCRVSAADAGGAALYAFTVDGPDTNGEFEVHAFDRDKVLMDPYAKSVFFPLRFSREAARRPGPNAGRAPLGILPGREEPWTFRSPRPVRHEHDLVIYEMHVRGFTRSETCDVPPEHRGTYRGVIDRIPYLKELGVTAVELMPVHQFDPQERNYWGYMTLNFFAPHHAYATEPRRADREFAEMVDALHGAGIEVREYAAGRAWRRVVDTGRESPEDIAEPGGEPVLTSSRVKLRGRSVVVLVRPRA
jgi:glycogen operon protein